MSDGERKLELLLDLGAMIAREVELDELLATMGRRVAGALDADRATVWLLDAATGELRSRVADLPELDELRLPVGRGLAGHVAREGRPVNLADVGADPRWDRATDTRTGYQTTSMLAVPIVDRAPPRRVRGVVQVLNKRAGAFTAADETYLATLADQIARALEYTTLRPAGVRGVTIRGPINHIVGSSPAMAAVYDKLLRAAGTDATVLLSGETGTGKGLFARALHVNSPRREGPFVTVDCTTLPANLVESELFGHERGAYTGASERVRGKVEVAAGGTLFLDELGEVPLELQGKLLRFLQERRFERVGGRETLEADVRIVAATNRDLADLVRRGQFRSDLFYRVRVVDVELPPLRARGGDDILALAEHFLAVYGRRYGKAAAFTDAARAALVAHPWPGNVRELEHAVERAVVLSAGAELPPEALGLGAASVAPATTDGVLVPTDLDLDEACRVYARAALARHGGNRTAAAKALGIGRNKLARLLDAAPAPADDDA